MWGLPTYELRVDENTLYLESIQTKLSEYKVICYDANQKLIKIEAIKYTGKMKIHTDRIIDFNEELIKKILPECFV